MGPIHNIPAFAQIMAWCRPGKPLSEPMMVSLPTHICVILPQSVKLNQRLKTNSKIDDKGGETYDIFTDVVNNMLDLFLLKFKDHTKSKNSLNLLFQCISQMSMNLQIDSHSNRH